MSETAAFPQGVLVAGMIAAALLAAGAALGRTVRGRAWAMLGALILTPVLLVADIWDSPQIETVRNRGVLALAAARVVRRARAGRAAVPRAGAGGREHREPPGAALRRDRGGCAGVAHPPP